MNVEIGTGAAQFLEKVCINGILVAVLRKNFLYKLFTKFALTLFFIWKVSIDWAEFWTEAAENAYREVASICFKKRHVKSSHIINDEFAYCYLFYALIPLSKAILFFYLSCFTIQFCLSKAFNI